MFISYTKYILVATLMVLYLFLPVQVQSFSHVATLDAEKTGLQMPGGMVVKVHCNSCPCNDEQGSDCCDTTSCCCSCHAPLVQHAWFNYSPVVMVLHQPDPYWSLPQVYLPIFVPPQRLV
jgi:hypothetical protein